LIAVMGTLITIDEGIPNWELVDFARIQV